MVRWLRWHCPPDTGLEIRALAVWGRARYLSVTEAPHNTNFHTWMGKKQFCFFQTAETGNRTPDSGVKGSGANHYPRAPAHSGLTTLWKIVTPKNNRSSTSVTLTASAGGSVERTTQSVVQGDHGHVNLKKGQQSHMALLHKDLTPLLPGPNASQDPG